MIRSSAIAIVYQSELERGRKWRERFAVEAPSLAFHIWPEVGDPAAVQYLVAWQPPEDLFETLPNLRVVFSIGAGVDQFELADFPPSVKLVRMLDPGITQGMVEYSTLAVLALHRNLPEYLQAQRERVWQPLQCVPSRQRRVGIMGLGNLGKAVAQELLRLGFQVSGWSRSRHLIPDVRSFAGRSELKDFLGQVDILICLLPLTVETRGILCSETFSYLPRGACIVSVGRGGHLCEPDLLDALASGQLRAAVVDVLNEEPPTEGHRFWDHPGILLTPHVAAATQIDTACQILLENIRLDQAGKSMIGEVDRESGY